MTETKDALAASADALFQSGRFEQADALYAKLLREHPEDRHDLIRLASLALLENRLADAEMWSRRALELDNRTMVSRLGLSRLRRLLPVSKDARPEWLLGQALYLRGDYPQAASLFHAVGSRAHAKKLASFKDTRPYQIACPAKAVRLPLVVTDPLPVVQVSVNGHGPVNFFIDTGGGELIVDSSFAREIGAAMFGSESSLFGGGKRARFGHGRVDSVALGDVAVTDVPVIVMDVRRFSQPVFGGRRVDGVIGTLFLYQFLATLDYPKGELVLCAKTVENVERLERELEGRQAVTIPFWMADHCMLAWGVLNKHHPMLLFVDTGLAGMGFTCPKATLDQASLRLQQHLAGEGLGGGGKMASIPFMVDELALGDVSESNIHGTFGPFPPQLENAYGFRIGGLVSHEFFRPYALTMDFAGMRYLLSKG